MKQIGRKRRHIPFRGDIVFAIHLAEKCDTGPGQLKQLVVSLTTSLHPLDLVDGDLAGEFRLCPLISVRAQKGQRERLGEDMP